ncbi:hypothetical protein GM658_12575 [Pseudoduganella eburnea]|uniref:Phage tail assembly protein n=1 Tax=Massilia eburnea TaxID=1776165 RepID=A0A6L6QGE8_9BURK|nr:hypothetical protein [Massilia eburnea]MTW11432.1 hypothetical protein [Massilia eburnea]
MAFKLALTPTYRTKVTVEIPNEAGRIEKSDFTVEFKRVNMDRVEELRKLPQLDVLRDVVAGFSGLFDETGSEVTFNQAHLDALLAIPHALFAMADAFWTSIYKAKEKN